MITPAQIFAAKSSKVKAQRRGFTLVEVLIASSIFVIVGLIGVTVFVNVIRIQRRVELENAVYEDARVMMAKITREIRQNTVDYEEYYNKLVEAEPHYGESYGCYGTRFYNPGKGAGGKPPDFGAMCNDGINTPQQKPDCVIDKNTLDVNTGQNPYGGNQMVSKNPPDANSFCDLNFANALDPNCGDPNNDLINHHLQTELYLINAKGTEKTLLARKAISANATPDEAVALLRLDGEDADKDGIVEKWYDPVIPNFYCAKDFDCSGLLSLEDTLKYDANNNYKGFIPISPSRTTVTSLQFLITPLEDPRKAFAENTADIQQQPHVTVLLTVQPSASALQSYNGDIPSVTLQTTVTSNVYNEVKSYFGKGVCTDQNNLPQYPF